MNVQYVAEQSESIDESVSIVMAIFDRIVDACRERNRRSAYQISTAEMVRLTEIAWKEGNARFNYMAMRESL